MMKVTDEHVDAYKAAYEKHMTDQIYGFIPSQNAQISREATRLGLEAALSVDEFKPCVIHYEEGDWSQMLIEEGTAVVGSPVVVEPIYSMADREKLVGFHWHGVKPAPYNGTREAERLREAATLAQKVLSELVRPEPGQSSVLNSFAQTLSAEAALRTALSASQEAK